MFCNLYTCVSAGDPEIKTLLGRPYMKNNIKKALKIRWEIVK
jgi:hypothetical protein